MSLRQVADGAARQMRRVWLGPEGIRWPFDATFEQWAVGAVLALADFLLLWLILPPVLVFGLIVWQFSTRLARLIMPDRARLAAWGLGGTAGLLLALLAPNPRAWVLPMPFWLAGPAAAILAVLSVRSVAHFIDWNRPAAYWLGLIRKTAAGPRPYAARQIDPEALRLIDPEALRLEDRL